MLVNKTQAAEIVGVSRRTFYNHITKKKISITKDNGTDKIDISELKRIYGTERILGNLQKLEEGNHTGKMSKSVQTAQVNTDRSVQYSQLVLEEKLKGSEMLIEQLKSEREQLIDDKKRMQDQLDKALAFGAPLEKLLTDQRENQQGRGLAEQKAIEAKLKKEDAEKKLTILKKRMKVLQDENVELKSRSFFQRLFG